MADTKSITKRVLTPRFVMSYPHVIDPKAFQEKGQTKGPPRFQVDMIFDPADLAKFRVEHDGNLIESDIKKLAVVTAKEQFPELADTAKFKAAFTKGDGVTPTKGWPFREGDVISKILAEQKKDGAERFVGKIVISAKSYENVKPILSHYDEKQKKFRILQRSSDVDMKLARDLFQGGNIAGAELSLRATKMKDAQGGGDYYLSFYINAVRFLAAGEPFGRKGMMDRFDGVYGGEAPHDPTAGMDDEIPF